MAEENKHPPTTEEQTPPEMPGKAPKMEQAEIPDVGGGPAPSAKVIDLSAVRSTPEKDAPTDIPKEPEAQPVSVTEYSKQEWKKPMPEPEKTKPKRGRPAKVEKAAPTEPGAKKEAKAENPRRGRPSKAEKAAPEQTKPPKAGKTHAAPEEKAAPPAPEVPPTPRDATRAEKEEIVYLDLSDLHPFKDHPFGVRDDAEMKSLVESVRNGGVNQPALVRPREGGGAVCFCWRWPWWSLAAALAGTSKSTVPRSSGPLSPRPTTAASMTARRIMTKPLPRMTGRRGTRTVKNEVYRQPL